MILNETIAAMAFESLIRVMIKPAGITPSTQRRSPSNGVTGGSGFAPINQCVPDYFLVGAARLYTVARLATPSGGRGRFPTSTPAHVGLGIGALNASRAASLKPSASPRSTSSERVAGQRTAG
jgi:hypothetical protein